MIDTVTFNPARLGQYERLKVSDGLTSRGGVQAQSMQVQSNGGVTLENESNYHIPQAQINGSLNMPSTRFETPKLNSRGGTAYFDETAGTDVQSHIDELTQTALRVKANMLEAQNIQVQGAASPDYDGNSIQGLKLGGNDIPKKEGCSGLDWVARTDASGNTYKVLGMKTCGGGSEPEETCKTATQSQKCCEKFGGWWAEDGTCVQTCEGIEADDLNTIQACGDENCSYMTNVGYELPLWTTDCSGLGDCPNGSDWFFYQTQAGKKLLPQAVFGVCPNFEEVASASVSPGAIRLTCEELLSSGNVNESEAMRGSCAFYVYSSHYANAHHAAGLLNCAFKKATWECEWGHCGNSGGQCR